jgi:hypothetical protein
MIKNKIKNMRKKICQHSFEAKQVVTQESFLQKATTNLEKIHTMRQEKYMPQESDS